MQSRVRSHPRPGFALPPRFGGMAALPVPHQHKAGGATRLSGQLQPAPSSQGQGLFRFSDHQRDGGGAQGFLQRPKQIRLALGAQQYQPRRQAFGQTRWQQHLWRMIGQNPDHLPRVPRGLKQRKGAPSPALRLMDTPARQCQSVGRRGSAKRGVGQVSHLVRSRNRAYSSGNIRGTFDNLIAMPH